MSQTDVASSETVVEPVGTQVVSEEKPRKLTKPKIQPPDLEQVKAAVAQELSEKFAVTDSWTVKPAVKFVIECPSGQSVLVKFLGTMDLISADLIE